MRRIERSLWVIEYINGQQFIGRFDGRSRTSDLDSAALWHSKGEAENALQALLAEAADRVARSKEQGRRICGGACGGMTVVREVRQVTSIAR
jgi:hypothetical protein